MADEDTISFAGLQELAKSRGPCITLFISLPAPNQIPARLKNALRAIEGQIDDRSFIGPIEDLAMDIYTDGVWANTLAVFRSPDVFRYFWMRGQGRKEMAVVASRFQIRQLLSLLTGEQQFYLLALDRQAVRLLHCRPYSVREISLKETAPVCFEEWLHNRQPDHMRKNHTAAGPSTGSMRGVLFGSGTDQENEVECLRHFWKAVDEGVQRVLGTADAPLLLAGVDFEVAIYREVSTYPRLLDEAIYGAPNRIPENVLQERAWEVASRAAPASFRKAMAEAKEQRERGRILSDTPQVIKAAFQGRVGSLFLSRNAEWRGVWDEEAFEPRIGEGSDDLLNAAAVETIRNGGQAFELDSQPLPQGKEVAAVLRF